MDNSKNDGYYVSKILADLLFINRHMEKADAEELAQNELLLDSMLFRLVQISENARRLSEEYKDDRPDIPWVALFGLRNRIVHDYGSVDLKVVYETLKFDIPSLTEKMTKV